VARQYNLSVLFKVIDQISGPIHKMGRNLDNLRGPVNRLKERFRELGKTLRETGKKMTDIGKNLSMKLTLPIAAFGALAVRSAIRFQAAMNMVGAVTGATADQFLALKDLAREMGSTTQFSASEAAEGMKFLGMAGLTVDQIIGALPRTLELAASAQLDLGTSADIVTNIMSGFRMETNELARANDVLVNAFTTSNMDLQQLGEGMKVVGPVAKAMQFRFTETAAALGILAKNAFQGTLGGTGLRRIMTNLMSPSKKAQKMFKALGISVKNVDGSLKDVTGVIAEFEKAQARGTEEIKLAQAAMEMWGQRGGPQFLALLGAGSEELRKFEKNLDKTGTAAKIAVAQMKGLPGAFKLLVSAFEAVQLSLMESKFGKWVEFVTRKVAAFLQRMSETSPKMFTFVAVIGLLVAAIGPLIVAVGMLAIAIGALTWPITLTVLGITTLIGLAGVLIAYWEPVKAFFIGLWEIIKPVIDKLVYFSKLGFGWVKKKLGFDTGTEMEGGGVLTGAKGVAGAVGATGKSETDINIKLTADEGTSASIEKVKKKKGDASVNVATIGYVGAH